MIDTVGKVIEKRDTVEGDNKLHFRGTDSEGPVKHGGMGVFTRWSNVCSCITV